MLGDGVAFAVKHLNPTIILDMATLTGAQGTFHMRLLYVLIFSSLVVIDMSSDRFCIASYLYCTAFEAAMHGISCLNDRLVPGCCAQVL